MLKTLWNGRSGLYSNQSRIDTISNNIANVDTNGYKKIDTAFEDIFYQKLSGLGKPITGDDPQRLLQGSGSRAAGIVRDFKQGMLQSTERREDLAINGEGYFRLRDESGNYLYTRDGAFSIDAQGRFVHSSGYMLDVENYQTDRLSGDFTVSNNGSIYSGNQMIGKINTYTFTSNDELTAEAGNLFRYQGNAQLASGEIKQGFIERSNVDIAKELSDMIVTQRAFELNSRAVRSADEMWQTANNLRGR